MEKVVLQYMDGSPTPSTAEAETFELCKMALILSGELFHGQYGYFYNASGERVIVHWLLESRAQTFSERIEVTGEANCAKKTLVRADAVSRAR